MSTLKRVAVNLSTLKREAVNLSTLKRVAARARLEKLGKEPIQILSHQQNPRSVASLKVRLTFEGDSDTTGEQEP